MKNFTFLCLMLFASLTFAQNAPIDFEAGGNGAGWTWTVFENATNSTLEIVANPDPSGINTSATVAKFTALQAGNPWAGCESLHGSDLGPFVLDATTSTIKIKVWKSVISDVGIKLASPTGWSQGEVKVANTLVNQWEELTFNFSSFINPPASEGQLDQVIVFPDFDLGGRTQDNIIYFDDITFSDGGSAPTEPTVAAPTPTQDAANVISLFSHVYTNVPVDTWRTDWSSATLEDVTIAGNATKKYSALDFVGIETVANQLDVSEMEFFHIDIWSPNFTLFGIKLVDFGADGAFGGGDDVEHQVNINAPAQATWVSLDIPLSDFVGLTTTAHIAQYILVGQPTGSTTVYVDNVFFYKEVAPVAENVNTSAAVNVGSLIVQLSEYTSDANGDALTYNVSQPDQGGSLTFDATTGTVNITVDNDFSGLMTIEYSVSDGTFTSTANIVVLIQNAVAVNLVRLNGKAQNNGNLIEWTTASEINNDYFTLYSSTDGTNYTQITTVKGVGNSNTNQHYQMLDKNAANGLTYYRLTQTDYDGTTKQLGVITVSRNTTVFVSTIEPNPASNLVSLSFDSPQVATATLLVYDVVGKLVYTQQLNTTAGNNKLTLDVSSYAVGTYFVTINTPNGTSTVKLLKK